MLRTSATSSGAFSFSGWRKLILSASSHMPSASADNLGGHPLDLWKYVHVSLVLRSPKLDTELQMLSHLCSTDWEINSFDVLATALLMQCMQLIFCYYSNLHFKSSLVSLVIKCKLSQLPSIPQSRNMPAKYLRQLINTKLMKYLRSNGPIMSFIYREKLQESLFHLIKSLHSCFLTETTPLSQGKKNKERNKQQNKTKPQYQNFLSKCISIGKEKIKQQNHHHF